MGINGKRLKVWYKDYKQGAERKREEDREIREIKRKSIFEARKKAAQSYGSRKKPGLVKTLGLSKVGRASRRGIAQSVGVNGQSREIRIKRRKTSPSKIKIKGKSYTLNSPKKKKKRSIRRSYSNGSYDDSPVGGFGFGDF